MKKLEQWWFKHYSQSTFGQHQLVRNLTVLILALPAVIGIFCDATGRPIGAIISFMLFLGMMIFFSAIWITIFFYHNWRIRNEKKTN